MLESFGEDNLKTLYSSSNGCNLPIINGAKMVGFHQRIIDHKRPMGMTFIARD
jgi:hypothetical protein